MKHAYIQLHIAVLLAGLTGLFGRLIDLNESLISWYRLMIAAVVMFLFLLITGKNMKLPLRQRVPIGFAGLMLGIHWVFFYGSIKYANISVGVVCFALTSFFNAILAPLMNRSKFSVQEILLSSLTLLGISLIFGVDAGFRTGIILGVISSIFSALYTVLNERLVKRYDTNTIMLNQMAGGWLGTTLFVPVFLSMAPGSQLFPSLPDLGWLFVLAVLCTLVLYSLIANALKTLSSFTISLSLNLEPIYTIAIAMVLFNEGQQLTPTFYIGLLLIFSSVALQTWRSMRMKKTHALQEVAALEHH